MRTLLCLFVVSLGCGTSAPPESTPPVVSEVAPPSAALAEGSVTPPSDFTMEMGGGEVLRRPPQPGEMQIVTRVEPRPGAPGEFNLVQRSEPTPPSEGTPTIDMQRVPIPAARIASIYGIIAHGHGVLEARCVDMNILDGTSYFARVHADGADAEYRCTNASTPEFDALRTEFFALVSDCMPPVAES